MAASGQWETTVIGCNRRQRSGQFPLQEHPAATTTSNGKKDQKIDPKEIDIETGAVTGGSNWTLRLPLAGRVHRRTSHQMP